MLKLAVTCASTDQEPLLKSGDPVTHSTSGPTASWGFHLELSASSGLVPGLASAQSLGLYGPHPQEPSTAEGLLCASHRQGGP